MNCDISFVKLFSKLCASSDSWQDGLDTNKIWQELKNLIDYVQLLAPIDFNLDEEYTSLMWLRLLL